jgi:hypothetical protein
MQHAVAPALAAGPALTDWLTAWGSVVTGAGAVIAVGVTIWLARRDRQRSDRERAEDRKRYEAQLAEERERAARDREDAERRLREERAHAAQVRHRDRQQASVSGLLTPIAGLLPLIDVVPNLHGDLEWKPGERPARETGPRWLECDQALLALRHAADVQLAGLGDKRAAGQYRMLVHLAQTAARGVPRDLRARAGQDLRRYALFVQASLAAVSEDGKSIDPGAPDFPLLRRMPVNDTPWHPANPVPGWNDAIAQEPGDPFYRPAD